MAKISIPEAVKLRLDELKKETGMSIQIKKKHKDSYYAYTAISTPDINGKPLQKTVYLGKITDNGEFTPSAKKKEHFIDKIENLIPLSVKRELERLKKTHKNPYIKFIAKDGFYVYDTDMQKETFIEKINESGTVAGADEEAGPQQEYDDKDLLLLQCLSMDSRMQYKKMARIAGLKNQQEAYSRVKSLVKKLDIQYTADIDIRKFNMSPFMLFVKFKSGKPKIEDLEDVLSNHPKVQFAALTQGKCDIIAYIIDDSFMIHDTIYGIFTDPRLDTYDIEFTVTPFYIGYGFIPLRDVFFDKVLTEKVWHKKRNMQRTTEILERERVVMKEIVINGGIEFSEIDKKYNLGHGAAQYTFKKLKERGFIYRETINMKGITYRYVRVLITSIVNIKKFKDSRDSLLEEIINNNGLVNKYSFVGDIGAPEGIILFQPVMGDSVSAVNQITENVKGIEIETLVITSVLVGEFAFRRYDGTYSMQYEILAEHSKITSTGIIEY